MRNEQPPRGRQTFGLRTGERPSSTRGGAIAPPRPREKELAPPPTPEEIKAANAGELAPRGILKKVLDTAKKHPVVTTGATLAAIAGGFAAVEAYQGNIPGQHRSVDQSISSSENPAPVKRLTVIPPGRENVQENLSPVTTEGKLPEIKPYIQQFKLGGVGETQSAPFPGDFVFRLKKEPPITEKVKEFTPDHPEGIFIENTTIQNPNIYIQGYVLAKEKASDGSVLIALGIPGGESELFSAEHLDRPGTTRVDEEMGRISNTIVWLKINNFTDYQQPLQPFLGWSLPNQTNARQSVTNDPNEIFKYIRTGDPVYAGGYRPTYSGDKNLDILQQNYQQKKGKIPYEEAKQQYLTLGNQNVATIQKMLEDTRAGNISLRKQLETKRYIIQTDSLRFVPRN